MAFTRLIRSLPLTVLLTVFPARGTDTSTAAAFSIVNDGSLGGRAKQNFWRLSKGPLNNHGFFYNGSRITCSLLETITIGTWVRVWNEELSVIDRYRVVLEPELSLSYRFLNLATQFRGGYLNDFTLGQGLTLKDFSNSGAQVNLRWNEWNGQVSVFTRGYGYSEDVYSFSLHRQSIPVELNGLLINTQGTYPTGTLTGNRSYISGYVLPNLTFTIPFGQVYAEYGIKMDRRRNVEDRIENAPQTAQAGLIGCVAECRNRRLFVHGQTEFRVYQKGFIPVTGVDLSRFVTFWDENDSRANWIDFFDSRRTSYWWYLNIETEFSFWKNWRLFARDELLWFRSRQKEAVVYPSSLNGSRFDGAIFRYVPSSNYYSAGIRHQPLRNVSVQLSLGNKLINNWGYYIFPYAQWGQRYIASPRPYWEVRVLWHF